jgi:F0F1-type ATP synthase epsilon subunit
MISTLKKGKIEITEDNDVKKEFEINGGVAEVMNNKVVVLAD